MARIIFEHQLSAWQERDALESPTPLQMALSQEGIEKAEQLLAAGWKSLSAYVLAAERDIAEHRRTAPEGLQTAPSSPPESLGGSVGQLNQRKIEKATFDAEWEEVLEARKKYARKNGNPSYRGIL